MGIISWKSNGERYNYYPGEAEKPWALKGNQNNLTPCQTNPKKKKPGHTGHVRRGNRTEN